MKLARPLAAHDTVAYFTMEPGDEPLGPNMVVRVGYDYTARHPYDQSELLHIIEQHGDGWLVHRGYLRTNARTHNEGAPA